MVKRSIPAISKLLALLLAILPSLLMALEERVLPNSDCDTIITKQGSLMVVKIEKVSESEILYAECQEEKGWKRAISIHLVKEVRSRSFGEKSKKILDHLPPRIEQPIEAVKPAQIDDRKIHRLAILSFTIGMCSMIGLLLFYILGFVLFLSVPLSIIFGFMALKRIRRNKEKYKGKGLAIAGIVLGFGVVAIILAAIAEVLIYGFD